MLQVKYWLWLTTRRELSLDGMHRILEHFGSPEEAYWAANQEYQWLGYLRPGARESLMDKSMDSVDRILENCDRLSVRIYTLQDTDYPQRLRHIFQPPLVLYVQGTQFRFDDCLAVAMAGTRRASPYGRERAYALSRDLTRAGALVVTGVVPGCDYAACLGALDAGGQVVCVLGGGVDVPFDERSNELYRRVLENGALVTEYPPGREPKGSNFPVRNRILTGLCQATLCVEGGLNSGTMLVAQNALDQGRDLYAVLPQGTAGESAGMVQLLKDGAGLVTEVEDILARYRGSFPTLGRKKSAPPKPEPVEQLLRESAAARAERRQKAETEPIPNVQQEEILQKTVDNAPAKRYIDLQDCGPEEAATLRALQEGPLTADDLTERTGLPAGKVLAALTLLTLDGLVEELPGARYEAQVAVRL